MKLLYMLYTTDTPVVYEKLALTPLALPNSPSMPPSNWWDGCALQIGGQYVRLL